MTGCESVLREAARAHQRCAGEDRSARTLARAGQTVHRWGRGLERALLVSVQLYHIMPALVRLCIAGDVDLSERYW